MPPAVPVAAAWFRWGAAMKDRDVRERADVTRPELWRAVWQVLLATAVIGQLLVWVYVCATLQAPYRYWIFGLRFCAVTSAVVFACTLWIARRAARPLLAFFDAAARGEPSSDETRAAYRATLELPRTVFVQAGLGGGVATGVLSTAALGLLLPGLAMSTQYTIGVSALATSAFTHLFAFAALRQRLAPCAAQIADALPDLAHDDDLVRMLEVRTKLAVAVVTVLTVSMAVVSSVAGTGAHMQLSRVIALGQDRVLANAARFEKTGDAALYLARNEANLQFLPMSIFLVDRENAAVVDAPEDETLGQLDLEIIALETEGRHGTVPGSGETVATGGAPRTDALSRAARHCRRCAVGLGLCAPARRLGVAVLWRRPCATCAQ